MTIARILSYTAISTALFIVLFVVFDAMFGDSLRYFGFALVEAYGGLAVFAGFLLAAVSIVPLPDHAVSVFAMLGGMGTSLNVVSATLGSTVGATIAYGLGGALGRTGPISALLSRHESNYIELTQRYGPAALIIACATPFPYSPVCWLCGAMKFPFPRYILIVAVFRLIKVVYVLFFVKQGVLAF